ncbi:enamine deaminase RidA (YjgF/YER057c/UK114 family) [Agromyces sp. 3263]|uniref:RidA family protein n=1 Tax=Agromyces sp. 3263 TaxID=2817750 RepID=UPI0028543E77|nr:RidA family protein [Agromyces sp. 3263]MDR6905237.1 enamine deaminase RidA (YjgF/YER057c/UK114 family) [Agromyces sp. 3263]
MEITHLNPASSFRNPAFSQGVLVRGASNLLYVGGQNATDSSGAIIEGGLGAQTEQALKNVLAVLAEAGADQSNVVRLAVYLVDGESVDEGYAASAKVWGMNPTALTVLIVPRLGRPDALVEIEAVAVLE